MNPEEIKTEVQTKLDEAVATTMAKVESGELKSVEEAIADVCATLEGKEGEEKEEAPATKLGGMGLGNEGVMDLGEAK